MAFVPSSDPTRRFTAKLLCSEETKPYYARTVNKNLCKCTKTILTVFFDLFWLIWRGGLSVAAIRPAVIGVAARFVAARPPVPALLRGPGSDWRPPVARRKLK